MTTGLKFGQRHSYSELTKKVQCKCTMQNLSKHLWNRLWATDEKTPFMAICKLGFTMKRYTENQKCPHLWMGVSYIEWQPNLWNNPLYTRTSSLTVLQKTGFSVDHRSWTSAVSDNFCESPKADTRSWADGQTDMTHNFLFINSVKTAWNVDEMRWVPYF